MKKGIIALLIPVILSFGACKHDLEKRAWNVQALVPLIKTSLSIDQIVADSVLTSGSDNSVSLVYQQIINDFDLASLLPPFDTLVTKTISIDSLVLSDNEIVYPYSLGQMANDIGGLTKALIISNNLSTVSVLPPILGITSSDIDIAATDFFETAVLQEGWMDIEVKNGLPVDITNVQFQFLNKNSGTVIINHTFPLIQSLQTQSYTENLAGDTVEGNIIARIKNMDIAGGVNVFIDTSDAVIVTIRVYGLKVLSATARFPAQDLYNIQNEEILLLDDQQIKQAIIKSGFVKTEIFSTVEDTVYFSFKLPGAFKQGNVFAVDVKVPPAPPNGNVHIDILHDLSGYDVSFRGKSGTSFNRLVNETRVRIDSTGNVVSISLDDNFVLILGIVQVIPSYARGYLGHQTIQVGPAKQPIDFFNQIPSGTIDLEDVKLTLEVNNGLGVDGIVTFNKFKAINNRSGQSLDLIGSILGSPFIIAPATDNPFTPSVSIIAMNKSNSNVDELIELLPDEFEYDILLETNPGFNDNNWMDFAYANSSLSTSINLEIPLSFKTDKLALVKTIPFSLESIENSHRIIDGILSLVIYNGFPLESNIKLYLLDVNDKVIDSLIGTNPMAAAPVNSQGKVTDKERSKIDFPISEARMQRVFDTRKLRIYIDFTSIPKDKYLKIYSEYSIDIKLIGNFNYRVEG